MNELVYIKSLHRPYNQNLKTVKWVCEFIHKFNQDNNIAKSNFYYEFYYYILDKLFDLYEQKSEIDQVHGMPSFSAIKKSRDHLKQYSRKERKKIINESMSERISDIDKSIFNTYKAISYFINLAKDKLDFVNKEYQLTQNGKQLIKTWNSKNKIGLMEKQLLFRSIVDNDFHFFISLLLLRKTKKKYNNLMLDELHYDFLATRFNVRHFSFTKASKKNYTVVRNAWIDDLDILDKNYNLKK